MDPEQELNDEQLQAVLKRVEIPHDLKDRLRAIPQQETEQNELSQPSTKFKRTARLRFSLPAKISLAASLLVVALFAAWMMRPRASDNRETIADDNPTQVESQAKTDLAANQISAQLAALDSSVDRVEEVLRQIEIQKMQVELQQLRRQQAAQLDRFEIESMIIALSGQTSIPLGGSEKQVELEMAHVIEQYPGSRGAQIASHFLKQQEN
jgi:hypothetical protein